MPVELTKLRTLSLSERPGELALLCGELLLRQRDEQRALGDRLVVVEDVLDEGGDLRPLERLGLHVDEERAGERRVAPVLRRLGARRDAARAAVDLNRLEAILVLLEVRE